MMRGRVNRIPVLKECSIDECREVALSKGLCRKHYQTAKRAEKKAPRRDICPAFDAPRCGERRGLFGYCDCVCHRGLQRCTGYVAAPTASTPEHAGGIQ